MDFFHHCFCVKHYIKYVQPVGGRCRNGIICFWSLLILVLRGCTKQALTCWKHDCLFWHEKGCGVDVLPLLMYCYGLT